jgi:hypothetical protein
MRPPIVGRSGKIDASASGLPGLFSKPSVLSFGRIYPFAMKLFDIFLSVHGVLVRHPTQLVSREMVAFAVGGCGGSVGMGCEVVEFGGAIMIALWHFVLLCG